MLIPIENVLSAFKSAVMDFMTERQAEIIDVPPGTTMKAHRQRFLLEAAETLFPVLRQRNCARPATAILSDSMSRWLLSRTCLSAAKQQQGASTIIAIRVFDLKD
ncbi:hypothetical protein PF008_g11481 [Phytophthora fragariae]|uniref:Uncharacterized protein n=1 Tax=Phytophthora fragariae TaxID=53985 RepID=A0A6G0RS82_9STRA|nr:hypothetical protein PF008_g11481 [Phytophthora fragariae]